MVVRKNETYRSMISCGFLVLLILMSPNLNRETKQASNDDFFFVSNHDCNTSKLLASSVDSNTNRRLLINILELVHELLDGCKGHADKPGMKVLLLLMGRELLYQRFKK
jgi:hypothetical protein